MIGNMSSSILDEGLSVIVPTYNGSSWLPKTINKIEIALKAAKVSVNKSEILVVNDGSTDDTVEVVQDIVKSSKFKVRIVNQANGGRFKARATGAEHAKYANLLYVDTRVYIGEKSLQYLIKQNSLDASRKVWCSHVRVDTVGNIYARFWQAIAFAAWSGYFKNPRDISYGLKDFDKYPKGTTCFFIKKEILVDANKWFIKNTKDVKTSNDDTLLIRYIAKTHSINISPDFWCLYHARSNFKQFSKHVFHRGKVFVDGFLRMDGNVFFVPLVSFLILSVLAVAAIIVKPALILLIIKIGLIGWALELVALTALRVPIKDRLSLFVLSPVFGLIYGLGIWTAFIKIYIVNKINHGKN